MPSRLRSALLMSTLALCACAEDALAPREVVRSLVITSASSAVAAGAGMQLGLLVFGESGELLDDEPRTWLSETPSVATVSSTGYLTGLTAGTAYVSASAGGKTARTAITVTPAGCTGPEGPPLSIGAPISSALNIKPCSLSGGYVAYGHLLQVTEAGPYQASISSVGFNPAVIITPFSGLGRWTAPSTNGVTASLRVELSPGSYIVWAATSGPMSTPSSYSVSVSRASGACTSGGTQSLSVGEARSFALSATSCVLLSGPVVEGWQLSLPTRTRVRIYGASAEVPPMVAITNDALELIDYAALDVPGNAAFTLTLAPGRYRVWAGSFLSVAGRMDVSLEELESCAEPTLTLGSVLNGSLEASDCVYGAWAGRYADAYLLTVPSATAVQIDQTSATLDSYVFLETADGIPLGRDDDSGEGLDSRLVMNLPAGSYRVWASSYNQQATGNYALSATATTGALRMERAPPSRISSPSGKPAQPAPRPWPALHTSGSYRK